MRLDFIVLWIEDQPGHVAAQIEAIGRRMREDGFELVPKMCSGLDEVNELVQGPVFLDEIDLILVDWDLGNDEKGQEVIKGIRHHLPFKEVVFYSALRSESDLRKLAFEEGLEGVYCSTRGDLVDVVTGTFEELVKRVLDLDHSRGIVMGATSDIDYVVIQCLESVQKSDGEIGTARIMDYCADRAREIRENVSGKVEKFLSEPEYEAILSPKVNIFSAQDRLRILMHYLNDEDLGTLKESRQFVQQYMESVVPHRNILGHRVLERVPEEDGTESIEGAKISFSALREARCKLLELRKHFRDLRIAIVNFKRNAS